MAATIPTNAVTDDAVTGAKLADDISITTTGAIVAGGGNGPTLGFQLKDTSGNAQPRLTNDANNDTVIRPGASGRQIMLANYANNATAVNVDDSGHVTMPLQPAFLAKPASNQVNFNQGQTIVIVMDSEIFDNNGDFASNAFTAPVTGRYAFQYQVQINDISTQDSGTYYYIEINTSNRVFYELSSINAAIGSSSGQNYFCFTGSVTADMDASDTCNLRVVMGGTSGTGPSDISSNSHFSGHLVC